MYVSKSRQTHEVPSMGPSTKRGYHDIAIDGLCMPRILGTYCGRSEFENAEI